MLLVSLYRPSPDTLAPRVAALWQGDAPAGLAVRSWVYLGDERDRVLLVWEAADEAGRAWLETRMAPFGELTTWVGEDSTVGMATAFARDLDGFASFLLGRGAAAPAVAAEIDLRRRGMTAPSLADAVAAGTAWAQERAAAS